MVGWYHQLNGHEFEPTTLLYCHSYHWFNNLRGTRVIKPNSPPKLLENPVLRYTQSRTSLVVQWLRLQASNEGDMGSIPGQGTKIQHAMQ